MLIESSNLPPMKRLSLAIMLSLLTACGGGGSGGSEPPNPPPTGTVDTDGDGTANTVDTDDDNDGVLDTDDAFPLDASESVDTDNDGVGNNADTDDDNDSVLDSEDAFPLDATESVDTDSDGIGNNADTDDDNDGVNDAEDVFPLDTTETVDTDGDGIGNNADTDDDNDGVVDGDDAFPLDATESVDTDGDGIGNNADTDDDNDGVVDGDDVFPLDATETVDTDGDGIGNNADTDDDNDGVIDGDDAFPLDATESVDTDGDGIGNNADTDDDNDGVVDDDDAFPLDATETVDTDGDGIGNNADTDDDNDGVVDGDDAFPLDATESVDTDGDGIGNNADTDDDNDGVLDEDDAFPLDATESVDTDGDGIGNNADTDDDNDGVLDEDDAFPLDETESVDTDGDGVGDNADSSPQSALCSSPSDAINGTCYVEVLGQQTSSYAFEGTDSEIYFYLESSHQILPFDTTTGHFAAPIQLNGQNDTYPTQLVYSNRQNRFYLGYENGLVNYINAGETEEQTLAQLDQGIKRLLPIGNNLLVDSYGGSYTYTEAGDSFFIGDYYYTPYRSRDVAWSDADNRIYFFRDGISPNDLHYVTIDPETGAETVSGESPYHGSYSMVAPIRVSNDGSEIVLGNGDVYSSEDLNWVRSTGIGFDDAMWMDNNELVLFVTNDDLTSLYRFDSAHTVVENYSFNGVVEKLLSTGNSKYIISKHNQVISITAYQANNDSDNDGVNNLEDAYPLDPAASLDSDNDGYPDSWNEGMTQEDSTTGLILDSYPNDSACYLPEHGDGEVCDYASTVPDYAPDQVKYDENGNIFLLHEDSERIYRWSSDEQYYTNPLIIGVNNGVQTTTPHVFDYSPQHNRIYLGYTSGEIRMINIGENEREMPFANLAQSVSGIGHAGNYLLAQDYSGAWAAHYVFDETGERTNYKDWNYYSRYYAWNEYNNRIYFFRDNMSPNDLHFEEIDQTTGQIVDQGETPYHSSQNIRGPIRISTNGDRILLGSGKVYSTEDLTIVGELGEYFDDSVWLDDIIVTSQINTVGSVISIWNTTNYQLKGRFNVDGYVSHIVPNNGDVTLVTVTNGITSFSQQPIADQDGDGLPGWWEALHDLNDNDSSDAQLDNDTDGLTNLQEYNAGTNPNNSDTDNDGVSDGDEVNNHSTDPLNNDSDGDGLTDGREINELSTNPLSTDSDDDGLSDWEEVITYATNPLSSDTDGDGMSDSWEVAFSTDPNNDDAQLDPDSDGLVNLDESIHNSNPNLADTDGDGLTDGDEVHTYTTTPTNYDTDADRMPDGWEISYTLDPLTNSDASTDLDGDNYSNLEEYFLGSNPNDAQSLPVAHAWVTHQGNAAHNGFMPVIIEPSDLSLRWSVTVSNNNLQPAIAADGRVFVTDYTYNSGRSLTAIDATNGAQLWQKNYNTVDSINPPAYDNGFVYFQTGGHSNSHLRALYAENGNLLFKSSYGNQWSTYDAPTPFEGNIYIAGGSYGGSYSFNGSNGEENWFASLAQRDGFTPAVDDHYVYTFSNGLTLLNKSDGTEAAKVATDVYSGSGQTPVLGFDRDLFVIGNSTLYAYDLRTNTIKWQSSGNYSSEPAVGLGKVFAINSSALVVLDEFTGEQLWAWEPESGNSLVRNIVVSKNLVFTQDSNNVYAIDQQTQQQVWSYEASGYLSLSNEGALYIATQAGELITINIAGDSDQDGMLDWWELRFGLDKDDAADAQLDNDSDGLTNLQEFNLNTNPTNADSDNDTINDGDEVNTYNTNPLDSDSDDDGLSDGDEVNTHGTDPLSVDSDGDSLSDADEVNTHGTNPLSADSDNDGMSDDWELTYATDPLVDDASIDSDEDGLSHLEEFNNSTNPNVADTDGDGLNDGVEVKTHGTNPLSHDSDGDRMPDGWEINNGLDPLASTDGTTDLDSDGFANYEEYYLNTNANDATSFPVAQPWATFQANARHDGFVVQSINASDISEIWRTNYSNAHQVVAANGKAFITGNNSQKVTAINVSNGYTLWEQGFNANSTNPPAIADNKVFVQTGGHENSYLRGFNADNGELSFETSYRNQWSSYQAPTPFGTEIYVNGGYHGGVYGFTQEGVELFHDGLEQYDGWTPSVDSQFVYAYYGPALVVLNRMTGERQYSITDTGYSWYGYTTAGAGILGNENNFITVDRGRLISFDLTNQTVGWQKSDNYINEAALAYGHIYAINNDVLTVLEEKTGNLLWSFEAENAARFTSNIVVTRNLVFVGTNNHTYAIDLSTQQMVWQAEVSGHLSISDGILYVAGDNQVVAFNVDSDDDEDGMPNWWENHYDFDPQDGSDAALDHDSDGLSNLSEFTHGTNPVIADTDSDGLNDGDEINTHSTDPFKPDTDNDGLTDGDEVNTHSTDPKDSDSDDDGFNDGDEVNRYDTDPNDANSKPDAISTLSESFETDSIPAGWSNSDTSHAAWFIDDSQSSEGSQSIRAGDISDSQHSTIVFNGLFTRGTFSFDASLDSESCCDRLRVYVDGEVVVSTTSQGWNSYSFELTSDEHVIEFSYSKDGSVSRGEDTVWIDNVIFTAQ